VFDVDAADRTSPAVDDWAIEPPAAGTRGPLVVRLPEVLDRALLSSAIEVVDETGNAVDGEIDVAPGEMTWTFVPDRAWPAGPFTLRVSSELEDVAGNSLRRVFDAEMTAGSPGSPDAAAVVSRSFQIVLPTSDHVASALRRKER
jgi:hypothetical protein